MENDEYEKADHGDWGERIDQQDNCRYDTDHPEYYGDAAKALAEVRRPEHGHAECNQTYWQKGESHDEQRIEHALRRLPQEDECRLIPRGRPRSVKEIGDSTGYDMRECSGCEHDETRNAQDAPEESGREPFSAESAIQGEEVRDPQDEDYQVKAILNRARRSDIGEPRDRPPGGRRDPDPRTR